MVEISQTFVKSPPIIWLAVHRTNNWWRFRKLFLWPSQNIWTLITMKNLWVGSQILDLQTLNSFLNGMSTTWSMTIVFLQTPPTVQTTSVCISCKSWIHNLILFNFILFFCHHKFWVAIFNLDFCLTSCTSILKSK